MDLFEASQKTLLGTPLAEVLRPRQLEDFVGQVSAIGKGTVLRKLLEQGQLPSLLIWGPPGTGKTSFANSISEKINAEFIAVNAVESGAKTLREIGNDARLRRVRESRRTILFVDEIHRFNKGQQDVLLPFIEKGDVVLIGATTENPSYEINKALLSRCRLVVFKKLAPEDLKKLYNKALQLYPHSKDLISTECEEFLIHWADGDARRLLNALEVLLQNGEPLKKPEELENVLGGIVFGYDKNTDSHYDTISAFIKSIRGSDADAALYYMVRMLKGGEDPNFIARRLVILASEDVGNADPRALQVAISGAQAVDMIGLPECEINLAQVVTYLASAPKSNRSYKALRQAQAFVEQTGDHPIPLSLRSAKTTLMKGLGYGKGYEYPHDMPRSWSAQNYWPESLKPEVFYEPSERGFEKQIREFIKWLRQN